MFVGVGSLLYMPVLAPDEKLLLRGLANP